MLRDHPHVKAVYNALEFERGEFKEVVFVETDLELSMSHPDYDAAKVADLLEAASEHISSRVGLIDRLTIRPVRR
jgi:hypothetical protein